MLLRAKTHASNFLSTGSGFGKAQDTVRTEVHHGKLYVIQACGPDKSVASIKLYFYICVLRAS